MCLRKLLLLALSSTVLLIIIGCASGQMSTPRQTSSSSTQSSNQSEVPKPTVSTRAAPESDSKPEKPSSLMDDSPSDRSITFNLEAIGQEASRNLNFGKCLYEILGPQITELDRRRPTQTEIDLMIPCVIEFAPQLISHQTGTMVLSVPSKPDHPGHLIHGRLTSVSNPQPEYADHDQTGCIKSVGSTCRKVEWEKTENLVAGGVTHIAISKSSPDSVFVGYDANDMSV